MRDKKKASDALQQPRPKRMTAVKHQLNAKKIKDENQKLLFKFGNDHKDITFDEADSIMTFIQWLEEKEYIIIEAKSMRGLRFELGRRIQENL